MFNSPPISDRRASRFPVLFMADKATKTATTAAQPVQSRIRIKIRAYDHKLIDTATVTIMKAAERSGANVVGPVPLPTERRRYTVNRSTFIDKTSRDQYEIRVHKRLLDIIDPTERTIDALMTLNLPAGVDVEMKM